MNKRNLRTASIRVGTFAGLLALMPSLTHAADDLAGKLEIIVDILNLAVDFIMVLALLGFIWGAIQFIYSAGDEKGRTEGKQRMVWGIIALFFMVAIWGLVKIIKTTFFG